MFLVNPSQGLLSDAMAEVLRVLHLQPKGRSDRAIAAACDSVSASQANIVLRRLEKIGVVRSESVPPAKQDFLNCEHVLREPLLAIANASLDLFGWLQQELMRFDGFSHAALFELEPAAADSTKAPLQLLVIQIGDLTADPASELKQLAEAFEARFGNALNLVLDRFNADAVSDGIGRARPLDGGKLLAKFAL